MSGFYRPFIRPVLFAQDPEDIHRFTLSLLEWASRHELVGEAIASFFTAPELPINVCGLRFPNPVGLAAGMDKDGQALPLWAALGFGHCELGAVTAQAQPGNPPPRVFRAIGDQALINRMGFNNAGAAALAERLAGWRNAGRWPNHPVGINLGKTKTTPLDQAAQDYAQSLRLLWPHADFFVVNVSSPNTPQLRQLQDKSALDDILAALQEVQNSMAAEPDLKAPSPGIRGRSPVVDPRGSALRAQPGLADMRHGEAGREVKGAGERGKSESEIKNQKSKIKNPTKPILVKVAPDLSFSALDQILDLVGPRQLSGLVATNTTLARPEIHDGELSRIYREAGGLSGRPLRARSTEVIRHLYRQSRGAVPIIGVGGIFTADDAWEKIAAGASLVQIYTSLVYEGPGVVKAIVTGLLERLSQAGLPELHQAVGCENRG